MQRPNKPLSETAPAAFFTIPSDTGQVRLLTVRLLSACRVEGREAGTGLRGFG